MPSPSRGVIFRLVALIGGLGVALVALEVGYRAVLAVRQAASLRNPDYAAVSGSIYAYEPETGYGYVPGKAVLSLSVEAGYPAALETLRVNAAGNIGRAPETWDAADVRVLGFGDSFTANPRRGGITWTDHLERHLEPRIGRTVEVLNFGRDGFGVLQMVRLARIKSEELKPDVVILAFILEDLARARTWRTYNQVDGIPRLQISIGPQPVPDRRYAADLAVVHESIGADWVERMLAIRRPGDPLLEELNARYRRLAGDNLSLNLRRPLPSFLYDRIVHGDPLYSVYRPSRNPRIVSDSYAGDLMFVHDAGVLRESGVGLYAIALPRREELERGDYMMDPQQEALLQDLSRSLETRITPLLPRLQPAAGDLDRWYLPDGHPGHPGADAYARAIAAVLAESPDRLGEE